MFILGPMFDNWDEYEYIDKIRKLSEDKKYPTRNRFVLKDILDLSKNGWVPRGRKS